MKIPSEMAIAMLLVTMRPSNGKALYDISLTGNYLSENIDMLRSCCIVDIFCAAYCLNSGMRSFHQNSLSSNQIVLSKRFHTDSNLQILKNTSKLLERLRNRKEYENISTRQNR